MGYVMFNRKLFFILLVFLLFVLHISIVCAVDSNQTHTIETNDNHKLSINNTKHEYISNDDDFKDDSLDFNQGDKIPITIDSPKDGNLTVLIDGEVYYYTSWILLGSETIYVPTYNPSSFYNSSIKNIGVGNHKISLVFTLNTFNNYVPVVSKDGSNLKFKFQTYTDDTLDTKYTYTHNLILNIHEKRKTINVSIHTKPMYYDSIVLGIGFDKDTLIDMLQDDTYLNLFGIILSNNGKILDKGAYTFTTSFDMDLIQKAYSNFIYHFRGINFLVESVLGICNLTVVNFADGTTDTVLFNVSKFITGIPKIECVINGFDATFYGHHLYTKLFFNIGNVHKFISSPDEYNPHEYFWNVTFVNLSPGVHVLRLYYPETDFIKQFSYNWTFEIPGSSNVPENINISGNHSFNMFPNMLLTNGGAFLFFSQNDGMLNIEDFTIIDDSGVRNSESNLGTGSNSIDKSNSIGSDSGNSGSSESSSLSNKKSYEIQEKSTSKVIDNSLIKLGLIIILTISFMLGFVRFKKRLIQ